MLSGILTVTNEFSISVNVFNFLWIKYSESLNVLKSKCGSKIVHACNQIQSREKIVTRWVPKLNSIYYLQIRPASVNYLDCSSTGCTYNVTGGVSVTQSWQVSILYSPSHPLLSRSSLVGNREMRRRSGQKRLWMLWWRNSRKIRLVNFLIVVISPSDNIQEYI